MQRVSIPELQSKLTNIAKQVKQNQVKAVNHIADIGKEKILKSMSSNMTIRNKYIPNSVKVLYAKESKKSVNAKVVVINKAMLTQEIGGTVSEDNGKNLNIPFVSARVSRQKNKVVAKRFRLEGKSVMTSKRQSGVFVIHHRRGRLPAGVYQKRRNGKLIMLQSLQHRSVQIKPTYFFKEGVDDLKSMDLQGIAKQIISNVN